MNCWPTALCLSMLCGGIAQAQVRPQASAGDPRLQSIDYRADEVVLLETTPGYVLSVELAPDEQIQSVAVGDSSAWQVTANRAGNQLFIKPLQAGYSTNMAVATNVRSYAFDLSAGSANAQAVAYTVRFRYPPVQRLSATLGPGQDLPTRGRYRLHGARVLRPARIGDDGVRTYIDWPPGMALPAVYALDSRGHERLANGNMRDGLYVIDSVEAHLVFRIDKQTARADRMRAREGQE